MACEAAIQEFKIRNGNQTQTRQLKGKCATSAPSLWERIINEGNRDLCEMCQDLLTLVTGGWSICRSVLSREQANWYNYIAKHFAP